MNFDTDTEEVEIEVKLLYYISGGKGDVIFTEKKQFTYDID
jgi:hypothetical protein